MITELHLRVKPQNNKAKGLFYTFFVLSFVLFALSYAASAYRWISQMAAVGCLVTAILLYTKFISAIYYYEIMLDSSDVPVFVVRQQTGRRSVTLCRIALADIVAIERQSRDEYRRHKTDAHKVRYMYLPTLFPAVVYRLTVVSRYENAEILLEGSDEFAQHLKAASDVARTEYPHDADE